MHVNIPGEGKKNVVAYELEWWMGLGTCFIQKAMRPWLLRILEFSLVESVISPHALGLYEGGFGPHIIASLVNEKPTWKYSR